MQAAIDATGTQLLADGCVSVSRSRLYRPAYADLNELNDCNVRPCLSTLTVEEKVPCKGM
jgi:hypothetical protein